MNCSKYLWPMVFASVIAGCSFTGGNAPITDGSATASVYTVKPAGSPSARRSANCTASIPPWLRAKTT